MAERGELRILEVEPAGEYAAIDVTRATQIVEKLSSKKRKERLAAIEEILREPERFAPPAFYVLSSVLFDEGRKEDAAFWFYAGQLRARFDANRCADASARGAVDVLNQQFGQRIKRYASQDLDKLEDTVKSVLDWDAKTSHLYDHRWINLHGIRAYAESLGVRDPDGQPLSLPEEQWEEIEHRTRQEYRAGFEEALDRLRARGSASN